MKVTQLFILLMLAGFPYLLLAQHPGHTSSPIPGLIELFALLVLGGAFFAASLSESAEEEAESSEETLKKTRKRLLEMEKMATLGQVTAGIAHEVRNPLNFVNNFSEVVVELVDELREELSILDKNPNDKGAKAAIDDILSDLQKSANKIEHHGKRASSIIRSMLMQADAKPRAAEPIDLNALVEEYVRLSFHGVRGKHRDFNCAISLNLDPALTSVNVVRQEIGRVLLNLITNALQAMQEKTLLGLPDYEPELRVDTHLESDHVDFVIRDNGTGIPQAVMDKIFTPFFTTKSPDEGTGLGMHLTKEMIEEGHGGKLLIETEPGEFTQMTVRLPL